MPPRRTATVNLVRDAHGLVSPGFRSVLGFIDDESPPRPRTLRIDVRAQVGGRSDEAQRSLAQSAGGAGVWWNLEGDGDLSPWQGGAAMKLSYGSTPGIRRTVYADLRAGEYNIPPCDTFDLSAAYWSPTGDQDDLSGSALELAAELADGECAESTPLMLTATRTSSSANARVDVPPGAYAFEVFAPTVMHVGAICGALKAERDFAGAWSPPSTPLPIFGAASHQVYVWTNDEIGGGEGNPQFWSPSVLFYVR